MYASKTCHRGVTRQLGIVPFLLACFLLATAGQVKAQKCSTAEQCLSLGLFYYNNDDISDKASQQFKLVMTRYPRSAKQVETAQYYLASYYQRKYYIQVQRLGVGKGGSAVLKLAAAEYRNYTDQYYKSGSSQWLADAFFNLALVYLQMGDTTSAYNELSKMRDAEWRDQSVYVYEVVWSLRPEDVVNGSLSTSSLANFALGGLKHYDSFDQTVSLIKGWCQGNKQK